MGNEATSSSITECRLRGADVNCVNYARPSAEIGVIRPNEVKWTGLEAATAPIGRKGQTDVCRHMIGRSLLSHMQ